jgi:hypothetical protein
MGAALPSVCNPYAERDCDPALDRPGAAAIRRTNLTRYLDEHRHAHIALIGEAAGYAGCRFTGIPFTCEAQLRERDDPRYRISSLRGNFDERSARCVWQTLGQRDDVILWNVFPWHPHQPGQPLSNRLPTAAEIRVGMGVLALFLDWLRPKRVIAVGRVAERALCKMGTRATYARHPSHGGQRAFQSAIHSLLNFEL